MLGRNPSEPSLFQMVDVESLVPESHQLRKIDAVLDLSFVPEVVAECYQDPTPDAAPRTWSPN